MPLIPITNRGSNPLPVAGRQILPGETRHFEARDLPPHLRPGALAPSAPPEPSDPLQALLSGSIRQVAAALPGLSDAQLTALQALEAAGQNRKGLGEAFAEEALRRADQAAGSDT